jgi:hypothetical protein
MVWVRAGGGASSWMKELKAFLIVLDGLDGASELECLLPGKGGKMMKKLIVWQVFLFTVLFSFIMAGPASATILFQDGFENSWSGAYAPGWANTPYAGGSAPVAGMQQTALDYSGSYGLKLTANSVPDSGMWWSAVQVTNLPHQYLSKEYNPYVSVWHYDQMGSSKAGQVYAVPDWVNLYIGGNKDWTDVQFGGRDVAPGQYYYGAAGENSPGWQNSGVNRSEGWHNLIFQLSSVDGKIHFFVDGVEVGASYRDDYTNLGTNIGLYTMFDPPLSGWGSNQPYSLWDNFEVGYYAQVQQVPEPSAILLLGCGLAGIGAAARRRTGRKG